MNISSIPRTLTGPSSSTEPLLTRENAGNSRLQAPEGLRQKAYKLMTDSMPQRLKNLFFEAQQAAIPQDIETGNYFLNHIFPAEHCTADGLEIGNYEKNLAVFEKIWNQSKQKKKWMTDLALQEGAGLGITFWSTCVVTVAIYFLSDFILNKTSDAAQANVLHRHRAAPGDLENLAQLMYAHLGDAAAIIGSGVVLTQALANAITRMAEPIRKLTSALLTPQSGQQHEAQLKTLAGKEVKRVIKPLKKILPQERKDQIKNTSNKFKGQIHSLEQSSSNPPDYNQMKNLFNRVHLLLSYPIHTEDAYQRGLHGNPIYADQIDAAQAKIVSSFCNKELEEQLDKLAHDARYATYNPGERPIVALFSGAHFTGKTWFTQNLKDVLKGRVISMSINEFLAYTGITPPNAALDDPQKSDLEVMPEPHLGRIKESNTLNEIILIDGVKFIDDGDGNNDRHKMADLKLALAQELPKYPLVPRLNIRPITRPLIIMTSNHELDTINDNNFCKDIRYINFPHWRRDGLEMRVTEKIDRLVNGYTNLHHPEVTKATQNLLVNLGKNIIDTAESHNNDDQAKIFLDEIFNAFEEVGRECVMQLDKLMRGDRKIGDFGPALENIKKKAQDSIPRHFKNVAQQHDLKIMQKQLSMKQSKSIAIQ